MTDIFISYSRNDQECGSKLAAVLGAQGYRVWWDISGLLAGHDFQRTISAVLDEAHCVIVVWSENSVTSRWVRAEAIRGDERGVLVPLRVDGAIIPLPFNILHTEDLRDWEGDEGNTGFQKLLSAVAQYTEPSLLKEAKRKAAKICLDECATCLETDYPTKLAVQPSVRLKFVYPSSPALIIENDSPALARDIKWAVVLWNRDLPDRDDPLPIPVSTFDWLKPHQEGGAQGLFGGALVLPLVNNGDRLVGTATVDCPECDRRRNYIVSITYGEGGWFAEVPTPGLVLPRNFTKATREQYFAIIESLAPVENRRNIDYPY
ncbi:toll/interleukin-1 receptor domain-containing protein [Thiothrix lacustris]|uniref:Toll/interleukin-1 receptor domain-containing protein n=1 Tax=Thiothrix lacustris TaxID=525917 RepID=A0ABY9MRT4_9GAMM|nr:toll/interleukin-1 receptor domain-containing protein [Thiothrix lacustris]WML91354.1 toll/interleukin-1 receptor domain-containing protein [Thiothrix lacustris]